MRVTVLWATAIIPLIITPGILFFDDVTPKLAAVLVTGAICMVLLAFSRQPFPALTASRWMLLASCAASALVTLISTEFARNAELAWNGSTWRAFGGVAQITLLLVAAVTLSCRDSTSIRRSFIRGLCIGGMIVSVYGIAQYFGIDPFLPADGYRAGEAPFRIVRPPSTLGHSDYFGAFLVWPLFAGICAAKTERERLWRCWGQFAWISAAIALVLNGSRGALLGIMAGLIYFAVLTRPRPRVLMVRAGLAIALIAAFVISPAGSQLRARLKWISDDSSGGARLLLWRDTLTMVAHSPLVGFGQENFIAEFPKYQSERLAQAYPDFYHESPHNLILDMLAGEGLLGCAALAFFLGLGMCCGYRSARSGSATAASLSAALVGSITAHQFAVLTLPTAFCLYLGAAILSHGELPMETLRVRPRLTRFPRAVIAAACLSAAAFLVFTAVRTTSHDHTLASVRLELDGGRAVEAGIRYENLGYYTPEADLYFSRRFAAAVKDSHDGLTKLRLAHAANFAACLSTVKPEQAANAWYNLAALSAAANDPTRTEAALRTAIEHSPNWFKPHWALARLLALTGRPAEARSEADRATLLNGGKDPEVTATLALIVRR